MKEKNGGNKYIERVSNDLKEYGKGYSIRNLHYMLVFSSNFSAEEILHQSVAQIP